jgi:hypothetical protein
MRELKDMQCIELHGDLMMDFEATGMMLNVAWNHTAFWIYESAGVAHRTFTRT